MIHIKNIKPIVIGFILVWVHCTLSYCQIPLKDESIIKIFNEKFEIDCIGRNENSAPYSLYSELKKGGLVNNKCCVVSFMIFKKKIQSKGYKRNYDFIVEKWESKDSIGANELHKILSEVIYDTFYEKPPKVVLIKGNLVYIISTWGAIYRGDIYKMADVLKNQFSMIEL